MAEFNFSSVGSLFSDRLLVLVKKLLSSILRSNAVFMKLYLSEGAGLVPYFKPLQQHHSVYDACCKGEAPERERYITEASF